MIHKYYEYRRPLFWVAAFSIFCLQSQVSLKKLQLNNYVPLVKNMEQLRNTANNNSLLTNEPVVSFIKIPR